MSLELTSCSCNLSRSSLASGMGAYLGFIMKVAIPQQKAGRMVPRPVWKAHCSRDHMTFVPLYLSWLTIQHTKSSEQPSPTMMNQLHALWKKLVPDWCTLSLTGLSAFRNSQYSCVVELVWSWCPPIMLSAYGPRLCSVNLCRNWCWWYSDHLNSVPSWYVPTWLLACGLPSPLTPCVLAVSGGLLKSWNPGVSLTHSPQMAWYPGGKWLSEMQLSGCELFKSRLDPETDVSVPVRGQLHFLLATL